MGVGCKCFTPPASEQDSSGVGPLQPPAQGALCRTLLDLPPSCLLPSPVPLPHSRGFFLQMLPHTSLPPGSLSQDLPRGISLKTHCGPAIVIRPGITVLSKPHTCTHVHPCTTKSMPSNNLGARDAAKDGTVRTPALQEMTLS